MNSPSPRRPIGQILITQGVISEDQLRIALKWLQSLEPTGVGASGLGDCLCLQLRELPKSPAREVAMTFRDWGIPHSPM